MDQGRIVAIGNHDELMKTSELYSRLAKLQFGDGQTASPGFDARGLHPDGFTRGAFSGSAK
jgi:hypothetical protein